MNDEPIIKKTTSKKKTNTPAVRTPAVRTPAVGSPAVDTPVVDINVVDTPAVGVGEPTASEYLNNYQDLKLKIFVELTRAGQPLSIIKNRFAELEDWLQLSPEMKAK
jgi:hypothetical protein